MTQTMKAVRIHRYGEPEVLVYEDAPRPVPQAGELLIRVHAAGVNPVDWKTRAGRGVATRLPPNPFPIIVGWDVSGVAEAVGEAVTGFKVGDAVYGMVRFPHLGSAYAEYVTAPAGHVAVRPRSLDHLHAAALPLAALTAWQSLIEAANLAAGQRILIHAAAGGVGHLAVQLAKWKGAEVISTGSAPSETFLRKLGVDQFINYQTTRFEEVVGAVDVVFDPLAGETRARSWQVLKKGGVLVSILRDLPAETAAAYGVQAKYVFVDPHAAQLAEIAALADTGQLRPVIDSVFPLQDAAEAHRRGQQGHTHGKMVLKVVG
jgi:NADPH:quinone reductase-like Zn-dependent oxidoreductase